MKKLLALLFAAALAATAFSGCGDGGNEGGKDDREDLKEFPVSEEKINLKVVLKKNPVNGDIEKMWFWEEMEKLANIHFEVQSIDMATFHDRKTLMIMTDQLPDMFLGYGQFDAGEVLKYGEEGVFVNLKDRVKNMKHLQKALKTKPNTLKTSTAPSGAIYSLPCFNTKTDADTPVRTFINTQWLKNLGMEMPATLAELHDVLVAFRDRDPDGDGIKNTIPLSAVGFNFVDIFKYAYGYVDDWDVRDGKIQYFPLQTEYRDYLDTMNRFYMEELIDHDFYTQSDEQFKAKAQAMKVGMFYYSSADMAVGDDEEKWSQYEAFTGVDAAPGIKGTWALLDGIYPHSAMITKANKYVEESVKFLDFLYTETGTTMLRIGPEKGKWSGSGGWYLDSEGKTAQDAGEGYSNTWEFINAVTPAINILPCWMPSDIMNNGKSTPTGEHLGKAFKKFNEHGRFMLPELMYMEEEAERINDILPYLSSYNNNNLPQFIIGVISVNTVPNHQAKMREIGAEELLKIKQAAYERYLAAD